MPDGKPLTNPLPCRCEQSRLTPVDLTQLLAGLRQDDSRYVLLNFGQAKIEFERWTLLPRRFQCFLTCHWMFARRMLARWTDVAAIERLETGRGYPVHHLGHRPEGCGDELRDRRMHCRRHHPVRG